MSDDKVKSVEVIGAPGIWQFLIAGLVLGPEQILRLRLIDKKEVAVAVQVLAWIKAQRGGHGIGASAYLLLEIVGDCEFIREVYGVPSYHTIFIKVLIAFDDLPAQGSLYSLPSEKARQMSLGFDVTIPPD